jgi:hypothetical protein
MTSQSLADRIAQDSRLAILQTLVRESNYSLNSDLLVSALEPLGIRRGRDYVNQQVRKLADIGAVTIFEPTPGLVIATLTRDGLDHVERRAVLEGVKRPSPEV